MDIVCTGDDDAGDSDGGGEEEEEAEGEGHAMEKALGLKGPRGETDIERRIRQGEMTPFGSSIKDSGHTSISQGQGSGPSRQGSGSSLTDFERYLADQAQKTQKKVGVKPVTIATASTATEKNGEKLALEKDEHKKKHRDKAKTVVTSTVAKSKHKQKAAESQSQHSVETGSDESEYLPSDDGEDVISDEENEDDDDDDDDATDAKDGKRLTGECVWSIIVSIVTFYFECCVNFECKNR